MLLSLGVAHGPLAGARRQGNLDKETPSLDMQAFTCQSTSMDADKVFKALADPSRRKLLDLLYEQNGQTLGQLCAHLDMARQSATQHLGILEEANLVSTVKRGREK